MKKIFCVLSILPLTLCFASAPDIDVIYGDDDRQDVYQSQDKLLVELSRASAALISDQFLKYEDGSYEIGGLTLEQKGICSSERFADQPSVASCSGFLVSEKVLVTAGHCVKSAKSCDSAKWVFDFRLSKGQGNIRVPDSSVFECKKVISRVLDNTTKKDFAVIELDRAVIGRTPMNFRKEGRASEGDPLAVIGHPSGLPTKISDQGSVRKVKPNYFVTNLDTYHGNSGSAVINTRTGLVEGILVRGDSDFVRTSSGCQVSKTCSDEGCRGEDVSYITDVEGLADL